MLISLGSTGKTKVEYTQRFLREDLVWIDYVGLVIILNERCSKGILKLILRVNEVTMDEELIKNYGGSTLVGVKLTAGSNFCQRLELLFMDQILNHQ